MFQWSWLVHANVYALYPKICRPSSQLVVLFLISMHFASVLISQSVTPMLTASDPKVRDKAFDSLRRYLISGRSFTELELLKLWKGLYYSAFLSASALPHSSLFISQPPPRTTRPLVPAN
jgi:Nucleolar protein,Nop52